MPRWLLAASLLLYVATPLLAMASEDRASVGGDITVQENETAGDIACVFCSVHVHGDVKGDVAVVLGSLTVDSDHSIKGDVAVVGGDLNMSDGSEVGGDVAVVAGSANLAPDAMIHGSRSILPGRAWLLVPFAPLLFLIGIIWLIVYLVRRQRYAYAQYPGVRRY
ncbi:hypothetical protein GCM10011507_17900 [Edaphobacter acidisoli]|uniref:Polymer-forming cytoskeletal protein n=1 Tax=Edaphobacter acidisoli TaxID=2040573 RepID=A0A916RTP1_9BACT|nr:hypothetical protein [Edaphobacter acidisoli]GGA66838.1 hypothetical protein GCM10011507_17900 [Edaphobacter acidisoli]